MVVTISIFFICDLIFLELDNLKEVTEAKKINDEVRSEHDGGEEEEEEVWAYDVGSLCRKTRKQLEGKISDLVTGRGMRLSFPY